MTKIFRTLLTLSAAALLAAPASAQTARHNPAGNAPAQSGPVQSWQVKAQSARVTFYDNDPAGSSRVLQTATLSLPSGSTQTERAYLLQHAPAGAKYAQIRVGNRVHTVALRPSNPNNRS